MGYGLPAPSTARRVRSGIGERTVAETRSNREDALIPAIPGHVTMQTKNMHDDVSVITTGGDRGGVRAGRGGADGAGGSAGSGKGREVSGVGSAWRGTDPDPISGL